MTVEAEDAQVPSNSGQPSEGGTPTSMTIPTIDFEVVPSIPLAEVRKEFGGSSVGDQDED
jgi:hypothetical protein